MSVINDPNIINVIVQPTIVLKKIYEKSFLIIPLSLEENLQSQLLVLFYSYFELQDVFILRILFFFILS